MIRAAMIRAEATGAEAGGAAAGSRRRRARLRTRSRFVLAFLCLGLAVMFVAVASIYRAVGTESAARLPSEAEALLGEAAERALDPSVDPDRRLEEAADSLIEARALLARGRILDKDAVVGLALSVSAILGAVIAAASLVFAALSRVLARGIDDLAAGVIRAQDDRAYRLIPSSDPDLDAVRQALNDLLDLSAEQERRLAEAARLEGWRETASFLAHQLKNPLAALLLAAENCQTALSSPARVSPAASDAAAAGRGTPAPETPTAERLEMARDCSAIVRAEGGRLRALIDRFRDLAPAALDARDLGGSVDLEALVDECAARARAAGATVSVAAADGARGTGTRVPGDRALLEQAFWNLFANAVEAGGGKAEIEVTIAAAGDRARVSMTDSNQLADPSLVSRLGRERITTKAGGTGLGLVLVRRILGAMGGTLELSATDRGGLGVVVGLPMERRPR